MRRRIGSRDSPHSSFLYARRRRLRIAGRRIALGEKESVARRLREGWRARVFGWIGAGGKSNCRFIPPLVIARVAIGPTERAGAAVKDRAGIHHLRRLEIRGRGRREIPRAAVLTARIIFFHPQIPFTRLAQGRSP